MKKTSVRIVVGNKLSPRHSYLETWVEGYDLGGLTVHRPFLCDQEYRELYCRNADGSYVRESVKAECSGGPVPDTVPRYRVTGVKPGCWVVSHKSSGLALVTLLVDKGSAVHYAKYLLREFPFLSLSEEEVLKHPDREKVKVEVENHPCRTILLPYKYVEA